jgi:hypothetical protein
MHIDSAKGERLEGIKNKIKKGRINYIEKTAADAVMILLTSADLNLFITPSNRGRLLWTANHLSHFFRLDSAVVCFADFFSSSLGWATWEVIHSSEIDLCIITQMRACAAFGFFMRVDGCTFWYT